MSAPTPGLVARWTTRRPPAAGSLCEECAAVLVDVACQRCGQLAGEAVGMLATVLNALDPADRAALVASYASDIRELETMTGWDLADWLS